MNLRSLLILASLIVGIGSAQCRFDYSDIKNGLFAQKNISGLRSMNDGEFYTLRQGNNIIRYSYRSGAATDTIKIPRTISVEGYEFSNDERKLLIYTDSEPIYRRSFTAKYYIYDLRSKSLRPLSENGKQREATLSPDGTRAVFVRDNNMFSVDLGSGAERAITTDGEPLKIINGIPDWVYEEEFGFSRGYSWSPSGDKVALLRFDESRVPEFTLVRSQPSPYDRYKYPKAGDTNAVVTLHVYDFESGRTTRIDTGEQECYIPHIGWNSRSELYFYRLNRRQNLFEVLVAEPNKSASARKIYEERSDNYIEQPDNRTLSFLPDGKRFIVKSEKEGRMHLYLHDLKKGSVKKITDGDWEVTQLVDIVGERIYYMSSEGSELRTNLFSIKTDGSDKQRLTAGNGTYKIAPSNGFRYFVSSFSNVSTPLTVTLHASDGTVLRTLEDNAKLKATADSLKLPVKEFFTILNDYGTELNCYIIRPANFDSTQRYPVLITQYSGPGSQQVVDRWSIDWCDVMVQHGYIVVAVDPRGTGRKGTEFKKCTYGKLGVVETEDLLAAARQLSKLSYIDASRIGIYGWSYGGFMSLNAALSGGSLFKMAIAVAPVTSWRFYDSIYTERYNGLPADNATGYDQKVPLSMARGLQCKLLLIHGTADDNVHIENSYKLAKKLVGAGKQFDMMVYPDDNHGMMPSGRHHVMEKMIDYTLNNL